MPAKSKTKTINVQTVRKPGELGFVDELLSKTMNIPASDVLAYAKAKGVSISKSKVYNFRWLTRKKGKTPEAPKQLSAPKSTAIVKAKSSALAKVKRRGKVKRRSPKRRSSNHVTQVSLSKPISVEKQMLDIIIKVGTIRSRELIDQTERTILKKFGL
jgi:hypothetical protein